MVSPLQKPSSKLSDLGSKKPQKQFFSPQRVKTPIETYKVNHLLSPSQRVRSSQKNFKVLNMMQLASNQKNGIDKTQVNKGLDISRKILLNKDYTQNTTEDLTSKAGKTLEDKNQAQLKPIPAMLYNSKKHKQAYGLFEQIHSRNSALSASKTVNYLSGKYP